METSANGYSQAQVLYGIREVWNELLGEEPSFDANTPIYEYMTTDGTWVDFDPDGFAKEFETFFDFACSKDDWNGLFGIEVANRSFDVWQRDVAPTLTFGALANFILERVTAVSFAPVSVFGKRCKSAGVFKGIQQVAGRVSGKSVHFAPSSRIIDVLRGHTLDQFWRQLRWISEHSIPELPEYWRESTNYANCFGILAVCGAFFMMCFLGDTSYLVGTALVWLIAYSVALLIKYSVNPLPTKIETFKDLSLIMASMNNES